MKLKSLRSKITDPAVTLKTRRNTIMISALYVAACPSLSLLRAETPVALAQPTNSVVTAQVDSSLIVTSLRSSSKKEEIIEMDPNTKVASQPKMLYTFETKFGERCGVHGIRLSSTPGGTNPSATGGPQAIETPSFKRQARVRRIAIETTEGLEELFPLSGDTMTLSSDPKQNEEFFLTENINGTCIKSITIESDNEQDADVSVFPFSEKRTHLAQILVKNQSHKKEIELAVVDSETGSENLEYLRMDVKGRGITLTKYRIQYCEKNFAAVQDFNSESQTDGGITIPANTTGHKILLSGERNCVKSLTLFGRFLPQTKEKLAVISIYGVEPVAAKR